MKSQAREGLVDARGDSSPTPLSLTSELSLPPNLSVFVALPPSLPLWLSGSLALWLSGSLALWLSPPFRLSLALLLPGDYNDFTDR